MKRLGLLGHPVSHSISPEIFKEKFNTLGRNDLSYSTFDLPDISNFERFCDENPNIFGLNITIPHKETILPLLASISDDAQEIGAVNTIVKKGNGWHGYNTDSWGFRRSLQPFLKNTHERALILGTGGASKAVAYALKNLGIEYHFISRNPIKNQVNYNDLTLEAMKHHLLVVNCTPVGMHPNETSCLELPWLGISADHLVVDLVYNPEKTVFMTKAQERGAVTMNGLDMLRLQADKAWEIWLENGL